MRLALLLLAALLVTAPAALAAAPPGLDAPGLGATDCTGVPCDQINLVCRIVLGAECLG